MQIKLILNDINLFYLFILVTYYIYLFFYILIFINITSINIT
jgi:hypothetical protein